MSRSLWLVIGAVAIVGLAVFWIIWGNRSIVTNDSGTNTAASAKLSLTKAYSGLKAPTAIASLPESSRLYIAEQAGTVRVAENGEIADTPFIDLSERVFAGGEMGLLGIAFHPEVAEDRRVFLNYVNNNKETIIASFLVSGDFKTADPASQKVILRYAQPYENHNGGDLQFGSDGYLYIASGDGGNAGDPGNRAQQLDNLFGKILRIDVDNGDPYQIPADNPFVSTDGARGEIWHYGLRNPWRFSFDGQTGETWIADVGQNRWEEVNHVSGNSRGGLNFGWRCYEADKEYNAAGCQERTEYTEPVIVYEHADGGCSVTGGYVYRGTKYPSLAGQYLYADYCSGVITSGQLSGGQWQEIYSSKQDSFRITTFGQDGWGELYLADAASGTIYSLGTN